MKIYASPDPVKQQLQQLVMYIITELRPSRNAPIFNLLGRLNDTTNIEDRNKLQNKGSKGLATTTQLYTAKWDIHN